MKTLVVVGDVHSNLAVGVCPPKIELEDGNIYKRNKTQKWLWGCWKDFAEQVDKMKRGKLIVAVLGEIADLPYKHKSYQYVTHNRAIAQRIGIQTLDLLAEQADYLYVTRGTEAHVGMQSELDEAIADNYDNIVRNPDTNMASWYWLPLQLEKVKCDMAHHVNMGSVPWTERNYANYAAAKVLFDRANKGLPIPDLIYRQHVHRWADSYDNYDATRCIIGGCWCTATSFIHRLKPGALAEIGGSITYIDGDEYEVHKVKYTPEEPRWSIIR